MIDYLAEMANQAKTFQNQGLAFFVTIFFVLALLYSVVYQLRIRSWPTVIGKLNYLAIGEWGPRKSDALSHDQDYQVISNYTYQVEGREYTGKRLSAWLIIASHNLKAILEFQKNLVNISEQHQVPVFYNPKNPAKSFLLQPNPIGVFVTLALATLPIALYISVFH